MGARTRKAALTVHVATSVGWFGSVAAFLALAAVGLMAADPLQRASYVSMNALAALVILPLAIASLVSGLVQSWGTPWGLLRHYWVVTKLIISVLATLLLVLHMQPIRFLAEVAATSTSSPLDHPRLQWQVLADASAALVALFVNIVLSVFKPRGMTRRGRRHALASQPP